jgi:hypothetical protein
MDTRYYLNQLDKAAKLIDERLFRADEINVDIWVDCVVLKIQRREWLGNPPAQAFKQSVFFSAWLTNESLKHDKLLYNIHALNLRRLSGYRIKSREFAEAFRAEFKPFESNWPNISTAFGPQTLMQGWVAYDAAQPAIIATLSQNFAQINFIIDDLFNQFKKT